IVAIQVGMVLAAFLFMRRMADVAGVRAIRPEDGHEADGVTAWLKTVPPGVEVFEVSGPFFFGAGHKFASSLSAIERRPRVLVLGMRDVLALDATGLRALETHQSEAERGGSTLVLSGVHAQPLVVLQKSGLLDRLGDENLAGDLRAALERAREIVANAREQPEPTHPV